MVPHPVRAAIIQGAQADLNVSLTYAEFEPAEGEAYLDSANAVREAAQ